MTTDDTGRAFFTVPSTGQILLAKASGASAVALIDAAAAAGVPRTLSAPEVASLREPFSICGPGFGHDAEAVHVRINEEPALVMAASPECLTILPSRKTTAGPARIAIMSTVTPGEQWKASTTLVALDPEMPGGNPAPGQKAILKVRVSRIGKAATRGNRKRSSRSVAVSGRRDVQEALTCGGPENIATVEAQAIRSGDFSFAAKLLPAPNEDLARAYLQAAVPLAEQPAQKNLNRLVKELERHPQNLNGVRRGGIDGILSTHDGRRFSHGAGGGANGAGVAPARSGLADYKLSHRYFNLLTGKFLHLYGTSEAVPYQTSKE